jgi:hypothetical protein
MDATTIFQYRRRLLGVPHDSDTNTDMLPG